MVKEWIKDGKPNAYEGEKGNFEKWTKKRK